MNVFRASKRGVVGLLALSVLGSALGLAPAAQAVVYQPCNAHDLREAVHAANATPLTEDVIKLSPKCKYVFSSPDPIQPAAQAGLISAGPLTIAGNGATIRITGPGDLRHIVAAADLTLNNLTLRGGRITSPYSPPLGPLMAAGSIYQLAGNLRGDKLTVKDNEVTLIGSLPGSVAAAGAILVGQGNVSLVRSAVTDNQVNAYGLDVTLAVGGGIYVSSGALTLTRSTVTGNAIDGAALGSVQALGGGLGVQGLLANGLALTESTVSGNTVTARGLEILGAAGGIFTSAGTHTMSDGTVSGNKVTVEGVQVQAFGGGINNAGVLEDSGSTISNNKAVCKSSGFCQAVGGGYSNQVDAGFGTGVATFEETTFTGNKAEAKGGFGAGGGIAVSGAFTRLVEATVTKNEAKGSVRLGGGIANLGPDPLSVDIDASDIFKNKPDDCWNVPACDN